MAERLNISSSEVNAETPDAPLLSGALKNPVGIVIDKLSYRIGLFKDETLPNLVKKIKLKRFRRPRRSRRSSWLSSCRNCSKPHGPDGQCRTAFNWK